MKRIKLSCQFILVVLVAVFASCSDSEDPAPTPNPPSTKSSAKSITSLKFAALSPEVVGTIAEADKKISAVVLKGTNMTALVPTIAVSEKATVSPASGTAQNFSAPVEYTVTAEDGTTQKYTVTVTESTTVTFTLSALTLTEVEQDGVLIVNGTKFGAYENNKVILKNKTTGAQVEIKAASASMAERLYFKIPADLVPGDYTFTVFVGTQSLQGQETVKIVLHAPEITAVDKTSVHPLDVITITGKYFATSGNKVKLNQDGFVFNLTIINESATSIQAKLPENIFDGEHTLSVISNSIERFYNTKKITVSPAPNKPTITNIDKSTYNKGDVMTITGTNLKKTGVVTYIYFVPFTSGVAFTGSGSVNAGGTQMTFTIPANMSAGTYEIIVDVDGTESESYQDIIKVN